MSLEHWQDAVDALRRLAACDVPNKQKRLVLVGAADFLEKHLHDPAGAIAELEKVDQLGLGDAALHLRIANVAERAEMWKRAVAALMQAAEASAGAERAALARRAGALQSNQLGDSAKAERSYRMALVEVPTDIEAAQALADLLVEPTARQALSMAFEAAVRVGLEDDPTDADALRKLRRAASFRRDEDLGRVVLAALVALGVATPEEREALARMPAPGVPRSTLSEASLATLRAEGDDGAEAELAKLAFEGVAAMDPLDPSTWGVGRGDLIRDETPLRAEVQALAGAFGLEPGDFYVGGPDATLVTCIPGKRDRFTWIVGSNVQTPLSAAHRFLVGQLAIAARDATLPLVQRPPEEAATVLLAAAAAADAVLPAARGRSGLEERRTALARTLSRKARRAIAELAPRLGDGARIEPWCRAAHGTALRAGMLLAGDLAVALQAVLGTESTVEAVRGAAVARRLLSFWLSTESLALRRELGLST